MKILFFVDRMRVGGIQTLLVDLFTHFDPQKVQCDLLLLDDGQNYELETKVKELGVSVYKLKGVWLRKPLDYIFYKKAVATFFEKHHDYDALHMNSGPKNAYILKMAKVYGIPVRIAHAHNSDYQTHSALQRTIGNVMKKQVQKNANVYLACSDLAAKWMFGPQSQKAIILPNGIDLEKYSYDEKVRMEVRHELGIDDHTIVVGNVGRFTTQKNHKRIIEIFSEFLKYKENACLLLAGTGELMQQIESLVKEYNIQNKVLFLGFRKDVFRLIQAMDVFLMPSFYEGFPVTVVEAQASGLPCILSDTISRNVMISDSVTFVSLQKENGDWAKKILQGIEANGVSRKASFQILREKGYDINNMIRSLLEIYAGRKISC